VGVTEGAACSGLGAGLGVVVVHLREPSVAVDEEDGLGGVVEANDGC
jgi:hypothetical protein